MRYVYRLDLCLMRVRGWLDGDRVAPLLADWVSGVVGAARRLLAPIRLDQGATFIIGTKRLNENVAIQKM